MKNSEAYKDKPDGDKTPERLEAEVHATRARIGDRLETLSNRLSPGDLLDQVLGMAREHGGDFTRNFGAQMKNNPVPTVITGIGLAWLMLCSGNRSDHYSSSRRRYRTDEKDIGGVHYKDRFSDYDAESAAFGQASGMGSSDYGTASDPGYNAEFADDSEPGVMEKARDAIHSAADQADQIKRAARVKIDRASESAHRGLRSARQNARTAKDSMSDFLHEQPVLAASLGVALGAALGALLPSTEMEEKVLGSASDKVKDKAEAAASVQYSKAKASAQVVAENARQVLQGDTDDQRNAQAGAGTTASINQAG
jgi:ElaB/YqjD/DUF883 family membrane-anchored ribosome-binding protein